MSESPEEESPASETRSDLESTQVLQQEVERLQQRIDELVIAVPIIGHAQRVGITRQ